MSNHPCLQDNFLDVLLQESVPVSIFLVNGIKLHGIIDQYDDHTIMLKSTITQMVYKHSISTVVPSRLVSFSPDE